MKETWKMIALLAIAIGGLLAYAFIPEQVAENIPLKQIGMDALPGKSEAVSFTQLTLPTNSRG